MIERVHTNQPLANLGKMSFAIMQTFFSRLEKRYGHEMVRDFNRTMKTLKYQPGHFHLDVEEIAEHERPPMIEIPEYREARGISESVAPRAVDSADFGVSKVVNYPSGIN